MLEDSIAQDDWRDPQRQKAWEELSIAAGQTDGAAAKQPAPAAAADPAAATPGSENVKQLVPSQASNYVSSFLFAVCQEVNRIGGHTIAKARPGSDTRIGRISLTGLFQIVLHHLVQQLFPLVIDTYTSFLARRKEPFSRDGLVQVRSLLVPSS